MISAKISSKMKTLVFGGAILGLVTGSFWGLQLFDAWWMDEIVGVAILVVGSMVLDHQVEKALAQAKAGAPAPLPSPPQEPTVLAICPQCKSRIPSESKFCLECGTNLQSKKTT